MAGDDTIGTACFQIVRELDAGDVYLMDEVPMPNGTSGEVLNQLARSGAAQLAKAMDLVAAGISPRPQPAEGVTIAPKITVAEARIDWSRPAADLRNLVMGCSPDPGAWCELEGERFKVLRAGTGEAMDVAAGQLHVTKKQAFVGTGRGTLELLEVQPAGKRRMPAIDWARNGAHGKVFA